MLIDYGDAVENFTRHRGFSHSLFVLPPVAGLIWLALRLAWAPVARAPLRWLAAVMLALLTHPVLDAHTIYGTQLWWPLDRPPVMWGSLFIIDPLFTLPLVVGVAATALWPARSAIPVVALGVSLAYLGWSWYAKAQAESLALARWDDAELNPARHFSVPTPFNTLAWRVVGMTPEGYIESYVSLPAGTVSLDRIAAQPLRGAWASAERLRWFTHGFVVEESGGEHLIATDIRMGQHPVYAFRFVLAERGPAGWQPVPPELLEYTVPDDAWPRLQRLIWPDADP